jgi:hypothetical protein
MSNVHPIITAGLAAQRRHHGASSSSSSPARRQPRDEGLLELGVQEFTRHLMAAAAVLARFEREDRAAILQRAEELGAAEAWRRAVP